MRWAPYALVRVVTFFTLGILTAIHLPFHKGLFSVEVVTVASITLYLLSWLMLRKKSFARYNVIFSCTGFLAFFFLGYGSLVVHTDINYDQHIANSEKMEAYTFRVLESGEEKSKTIRYKAHITSVKDSVWKTASGDVFLYLKKEMPELILGATYLIVGSPVSIDPPMNPGEFDYKQFLVYQNIYYQQFLTEPPLTIDNPEAPDSTHKIGFSISKWAEGVFHNYIEDAESRGIALALVLGIRDDLNNRIREAYAASGAMHVLAVSGLHVGIIYFLLIALFGKLQSIKWGRWLFAILALAVLWVYAFITGFSPSVSRAVTMFSFVIVAKAIHRKSNIFNTLAASALVLLFFDPYLIMSVGFQLSYLAVLGIVFLQPRIYNLWLINNYLLDKIWAITAVSIAAQLATFPLGLLYFHQFPNFFLLSNLVVIPAAFTILICGLLLLAVSWIPIAASWVGGFLGGFIGLVNAFIFWVESLPYSRIENVFISPDQAAVIILFIILFAALLITKKKQLIYSTALVGLVFMGSVAVDFHYRRAVNRLTFYKVNRHTAVDWISGNQCHFWTDTDFVGDTKNQQFSISPNRTRLGVSEVHSQSFSETSAPGITAGFIGSKRVIVIGDVNKSLRFKEKVVTDFLVYTHASRRSLKWVKANFNFERLLIGGDVYTWRANQLVSEAEKLNLSYYSIHHNGAFEYEL